MKVLSFPIGLWHLWHLRLSGTITPPFFHSIGILLCPLDIESILYLLDLKTFSDLVGMVGEVMVEAVVTDAMALAFYTLAVFLPQDALTPSTFQNNFTFLPFALPKRILLNNKFGSWRISESVSPSCK